MDAVDEFLFASDPDAPQHAARHFAEHGFNDIEPRAMFWREDEFESVRVKTEPALRLFGNMRGVIVEQEANAGLERVDLVQFSQQHDEVCAGVPVPDNFGNPARVKIQTGQQRDCAEAFVLIVAKMARELIRCGRRCRSIDRAALFATTTSTGSCALTTTMGGRIMSQTASDRCKTCASGS